MQTGEKVVAPNIFEKDQGKTENEDQKKCRFIARAKRPSGNGPWWSGGKLGGEADGDDFTGHTFCAHEDESGARKWYGFYPKGAIVGWEQVPEEDRIEGVFDLFSYVKGHLFFGDGDHEYDDEIVYVIDRGKYDNAENFASNWRSENVKYSLAFNNCTTFVIKDGRAAGISLPSGGWAFSNPSSFGKNIEKEKKKLKNSSQS